MPERSAKGYCMSEDDNRAKKIKELKCEQVKLYGNGFQVNFEQVRSNYPIFIPKHSCCKLNP